MLHHICQITYETNHGLDEFTKCKLCLDCRLKEEHPAQAADGSDDDGLDDGHGLGDGDEHDPPYGGSRRGDGHDSDHSSDDAGDDARYGDDHDSDDRSDGADGDNLEKARLAVCRIFFRSLVFLVYVPPPLSSAARVMARAHFSTTWTNVIHRKTSTTATTTQRTTRTTAIT